MKEIINSFLQDSKDGKKKLMEWFLSTVMEAKAGINAVTLPYKRSEKKKKYRM
ncbi:MAG: hypothetical protein QXZ44_07290 [Ferroplasma sp.]